MKTYRREVKYKWFQYNGYGGDILIDETEWMSEEKAKEKNIEIFNNGYNSCYEYERFLPIDE